MAPTVTLLDLETIGYRDIVWYQWLYMVSPIWEVVSLHYRGHSRIKNLVPAIYIGGYIRYWLFKEGRQKWILAHRLVAQAFLHNPDNKPQINHINGVRNDNRLENLEWCTSSENNKHKFVTLWYKNLFHSDKNPSTGYFGSMSSTGKKVLQYDRIGNFIKWWGSVIDASVWLWLGKTSISWCCRGKNKSAGWFIWKYLNFV